MHLADAHLDSPFQGLSFLPSNEFKNIKQSTQKSFTKAIDTALKAVRAGGKILVFSSTPLSNGYPNNEIYYKELTVLGSYSPSPADLKDSFDLLASGKVNVKGLTTVYPLDKIQQAFDDTVANKIFKAYIKIAG